jgi:hypothetical protein
MIPSPMLLMLAVVIAFVFNGFYWNAHGSNAADVRWAAKIEKERADSLLKARAKEKEMQDGFDAAAKKQAARLADTRRNLDIALDGLRDRSERPSGMPEGARAGCTGGTGAELSRPDAGFLAGEAARADDIRAGLVACYEVIDAVRR